MKPLKKPLSLRLRETGAFGVDEDAVAGAEILRERLHATDLLARLVREAVHEHVGNAMTHDVEAGVPEELLLEDVPEPKSVRATHESGRQQRVDGAGVPQEE